jgi:hypothetical protein
MEELLASLGMGDRDVSVEVDETTPARIRVEMGDVIRSEQRVGRSKTPSGRASRVRS